MVFRLLISVAVVSVLGFDVEAGEASIKAEEAGEQGTSSNYFVGEHQGDKKKVVSTARASEGAPSLSHNCDLVFPFLVN